MEGFMYDYHVHSMFSSDGNDTIYDICKTAVEKGLKEIAITDHFEPTTGNEDYTYLNPYKYSEKINEAKEAFDGKLKIKTGIELGQPHRFLMGSKRVLNKIKFDYVIASAHKFPGDVDCSEIEYMHISLEDICIKYMEQLLLMIEYADFDCVGHFDLIKRYSKHIYRKRVTLNVQRAMLAEILKVLILSGKGLEINTSGLRQNIKETMPGIDILKLYRELGGEILTVGSDAHFAKHVGEGISDAVEIARQAGFKYLTVYTGREPSFIRICDRIGTAV